MGLWNWNCIIADPCILDLICPSGDISCVDLRVGSEKFSVSLVLVVKNLAF